jgi:hypothetical protein
MGGGATVPDIFLSFATQRNVWKNKFVEVSQLGNKLRVLDYRDRPLVAGGLSQALEDRLKDCRGFIALIDEAYTKSDACIDEFTFAARQFGLDSDCFGAVVLDSPGREFMQARRKAASSKRIYVDLVGTLGSGPRSLDDDRDVQTILRFAEGLLKAVTEAAPATPRAGPTPRVIVLGLPLGASSDEIVTQRRHLLEALGKNGIPSTVWDDGWTASQTPDLVKKALAADRPPLLVLPVDKAIAFYFSKMTLREAVRKALGHSVARTERQLPKCVVWCPVDPPPTFIGNESAGTDTDDCLRSDPLPKLIEWLRAELGIATWKTAVISVEGFNPKKSDEANVNAANKIGRHLRDILLPKVRDICRPPEPIVTNLYPFESQKVDVKVDVEELARQLKNYVGSGVAVLTIHDLSLGMAPDWPTAYSDLKLKISSYQKLINKIIDQKSIDPSRIVKLAIVMSNREFKLGSEIYGDDELVGWKIIGMSLLNDGTIDVEASDTQLFTDAVCCVVNTL